MVVEHAATNYFILNTSNFNALTTVVLTGDKQTGIDLRSVLDASTLNFLTIPNEYAHFKSYNNIYEDETYDKFSVLYRMSLWDNNTEFIQYVNKMQHETIWRISPLDAITDKELNQSTLILPVKTNVNNEFISNIWNVQLSRPDNCIYTSNNNDSLLIPGFCFDETKYNKNGIQLNTRNYLNLETKTYPHRTQIVAPMDFMKYVVKTHVDMKVFLQVDHHERCIFL